MLERLPRLLLHAEGLAVAATWLYFDAGYEWWLLLVLALAPDLSMVGYVAGPRVGLTAVLAESDTLAKLALIWLAHIGVDRAIGYGLKYPGGFEETHLQRV
jgi:hypothetical protein